MDNIEWIFFDVGSTLVDESKVYEHIFRDIAELTNLGYSYIYNEAIELYEQNKKGDIELCRIHGIPKRKWYIEDEILYKDTPGCLQALSRKYRIGIIANQPLGIKERLEKWGLLKYIELVIASAEEGVSKPDPAIFKIALDRAGCNADRSVMVGDRIDNDIVPARNIGMHTIWIKQGFGAYWTFPDDAEKADYQVSNLNELCNIL